MSLKPGFLLKDRYKIEAVLGEGGMGAVYRALDMQTSKACAVKEFRMQHLPSEAELQQKAAAKAGAGNVNVEEIVTREKALAQFKREAEILAEMEHPNLPRVTDYFPVGADYYLVMTLIEGKNAATLLASMGGKPLPERAVLVWIRQVMDALIYCHARNVIHRDIKPANIILTVSGIVYLVDFGIAKVDQPHKETSIGARVVTPGYSPPEQYSLGRTDGRSDVYSLGATLYAMLTGHEPVEAINRLMGIEMPVPSDLVPTLSPVLDASIIRATQLKPEDRFQSVQEMQSVIFSRSRPTRQVMPEETRIASAEIEKNPPQAGKTMPLVKVIEEPAVEEKAPPQQQKEKPKAGFFQNIFGVKDTQVDGNAVVEPPVVTSRKSEIILNEAVQNITWSPSGRLLFMTTTHGVYVFDQEHVRNILRDDYGWGNNCYLAVSADEMFIAHGANDKIQLWNVAGGQKVRDFSIDQAYQITGLIYMSHGALMAAGASLTQGTVKIWEMQSRREMLSLSEQERMVGSTVFARSGRLIAIDWTASSVGAKKDGMVKVWNLSARSEMGTFPVLGNVVPCFDFSPDEKLLAFGSAQALHKKNVRIIRLPTVKGEIFGGDHAMHVVQVTFSPDGRFLASIGQDGTAKLWGVEDKSEVFLSALEDVSDATCLSIAPSGKMMAIGTRTGKVYLRAVK